MVTSTISLSNKGDCVIYAVSIVKCYAFNATFPLQLSRESVDNYKPGHPIPACQVQLVWLKIDELPKELSYMIHVTGVIPQDTHIRVTRNPIVYGQKITRTMHIMQYRSMFAVQAQWQQCYGSVFTLLKLCFHSSCLQAIALETVLQWKFPTKS